MQQRAGRPFQRTRLRYDATFTLEAGYCFDHGIPYSDFLERWSPEDRAKVSAVAIERSAQCPSCGTSPWEWEEDPFAYEVMRMGCTGCMKRELMSRDDTPTPPGTSIRLLPKATAERLSAEIERRKAAGTLLPRPRREE